MFFIRHKTELFLTINTSLTRKSAIRLVIFAKESINASLNFPISYLKQAPLQARLCMNQAIAVPTRDQANLRLWFHRLTYVVSLFVNDKRIGVAITSKIK